MKLPAPLQSKTMRGMSVLEILIAMGVVSLLFSTGLWFSMDFYRANVRGREVQTVIQLLQQARGDALHDVRALAHGVRISTSTVTLFTGASYSARTASLDYVVARAASGEHSGLAEVVFSPHSGASASAGDIVLTSQGVSSTISINYEGRINW